MIHLDTTFVVDLHREAAKKPAAAMEFLEANAAEPLSLSVHALCELEAGVQLSRHPAREQARLHRIIAGIAIAYPNDVFADVYARTYVTLERRGKRMPTMDLLIAVAALVDNASLVTRNAKDFVEVPDLTVLTY